jgi:methyltransferase NSUN6
LTIEIIVDCSSGASLLRGADLYVAGIIGMNEFGTNFFLFSFFFFYILVFNGDLVSIWADLDGNCSKGSKKIYLGRKIFIGNGICQVNRLDVFGEACISDTGVKMTEMTYKMPSFNGIFTDFIFLQNLPSIAVSQLLNPSPNSRVLDMCASPGGKTCHTAAIMKNTGKIFALDKIVKKAARIQENCDRLGIKNVQVLTADSSKLLEKDIFEPESFDYIILDPPCSGLGLRPNLKFSLTEWENLNSYAPYQRKLFMQAWELLKPGGEMTYSTCTLNPLENELLVDKMLNNLNNIELLPVREGFMKNYCLPGLQVGSLDEKTCQRCICRFWPSPERDSNGFFFVKFKKNSKIKRKSGESII